MKISSIGGGHEINFQRVQALALNSGAPYFVRLLLLLTPCAMANHHDCLCLSQSELSNSSSTAECRNRTFGKMVQVCSDRIRVDGEYVSQLAHLCGTRPARCPSIPWPPPQKTSQAEIKQEPKEEFLCWPSGLLVALSLEIS